MNRTLISPDRINPYTPPEVGSAAVDSLPEGVAFVVNDRGIVSRDEVVLPRFCVANGSDQDLRERVTPLDWCDPIWTWVATGAVLVMALAFVFAAAASRASWWFITLFEQATFAVRSPGLRELPSAWRERLR